MAVCGSIDGCVTVPESTEAREPLMTTLEMLAIGVVAILVLYALIWFVLRRIFPKDT